ncbi:TadE/TadG family type IV pilus assembly protein [Massilia pseudoviolaceinigra]|uniref:TadE/TadG family type IV pilus assembly protein n=1 Tax=Massilia pseudoviolaceinigra TaxID=3057165 RepID=UPI0027963D90|nr:TadE family protein [Massilia sp. CCM 9206]MDQ1921868.1 pilus assembly protein [Massilia sp. CCM 9206]
MHQAFRTTGQRIRGGAVVEFAMTLPIFLLFTLGLLEMARAMYLWNMLSNATYTAARGAALVEATDTAALEAVAQAAALAARGGGMSLGASGADARIAISHLRSDFGLVTSVPACPSQNIVNCNANPNGASCVRFVRAQLCAPGSGAGCEPATYKPLFAGKALGWGFTYPSFAAVVPAASLGRQAGSTEVCPGP